MRMYKFIDYGEEDEMPKEVYFKESELEDVHIDLLVADYIHRLDSLPISAREKIERQLFLRVELQQLQAQVKRLDLNGN